MIYGRCVTLRLGAFGSHGARRVVPQRVAMDKRDSVDWANEEFGALRLGHLAREACARTLLGLMARGSGTRVTDFTETSAERQQAYGFIENEAVAPQALTMAAGKAALLRVEAAAPWCIVPVDGSSLQLADEFGKKGFGRVGGADSTRGLIVQTAMAVSLAGAPLGLLAQVYWARSLGKVLKGKRGEQRKVEDKEVRYWLDVVKAAEAVSHETGGDGRLWFQLDRGYDCSAMLEHMATSNNRFTVRGEYNRALWVDADDTDAESNEVHCTIREALDAAPLLSTLTVHVNKGTNRTEREAHLGVKVVEVEVRLSDRSKRIKLRGDDGKTRKVAERWPRTLTALRVVEQDPPAGEAPLDWMLWVNAAVTTGEEAELVVRSYALRWRVEEFHKMWKSGAMKVEETQARSGDNVERIARMSALVACRMLRLTYLARETPEADASKEFSRAEMAVLIHMDPRSPKQAPRPQKSGTLAWAIAVIADLGGYTGKSSGGPPGPLVFARGFQRLLDRAAGFAAAMAIRDQW